MNSEAQVESSPSFNHLWEKSASTYAFFDDGYFPARLKMDLIRKYSSHTSRCLDIGIANGIFSLPLAPFVQSIDGVDISGKMLEKCHDEAARYSISNIHLHEQSAEWLPFQDAYFDLIYSFATLSLVPNIDQAFREISRTLKKGGHAILDITGKRNLSRIYWNKYYRSIGHFGLHAFTLEEITDILLKIDLAIIENHSIGVLDQWKYIPGIHKITFLEKIFHRKNASPDLDYSISNLFPQFANHWIMVVKKN